MRTRRERHIVARRLRRESTAAERELWRLLRRKALHGLKVRRQHPIGKWIADFCCPHLVIEVDGGIHDDPDRKVFDARRTLDLNLMGYKVIRFTNAQVFHHGDFIIRQLEDFAAYVLGARR